MVKSRLTTHSPAGNHHVILVHAEIPAKDGVVEAVIGAAIVAIGRLGACDGIPRSVDIRRWSRAGFVRPFARTVQAVPVVIDSGIHDQGNQVNATRTFFFYVRR